MRSRWNFAHSLKSFLETFERGLLSIVLPSILVLSPNLQPLAAQSLSPALLDQAKRMSPAQRAAIAKQHGISLDSGLATANENLEAQTVQEPLRRPSEYQESEPMEERTQDRAVSRLPRFGERFFAMDDSMYEPPVPRQCLKTTCLGLATGYQSHCLAKLPRGTRS